MGVVMLEILNRDTQLPLTTVTFVSIFAGNPAILPLFDFNITLDTYTLLSPCLLCKFFGDSRNFNVSIERRRI